ncbi:TMV resistance protein [Nymphaea thermarum]|nr:TMV resistance protein [Nymphaea thermarum]
MERVVVDQKRPSSSVPPYEEGRSEFEFDVFISYARGDRDKVFAGELNKVLKQRAVQTFFADEEERENEGERMGEVFAVIGKSQIFIPIFSKCYANSRWRLMEIANIVNCKRLILPVFFDIDPKHVRSQEGPFLVPFKKHEEDHESGKEQEQKFIHLIVKRVSENKDKFEMHDQVQEMGRQIVREEGFPELRSRLWDAHEALNVLQGFKTQKLIPSLD